MEAAPIFGSGPFSFPLQFVCWREVPMELHLGTAPMSDDAFLQGFEACQLDPVKFHHADHIRLAWLCVNRYGTGRAEARLLEGIRKFALHAGAPRKFHCTITIAWVRLVAMRPVRSKADVKFEDWIAKRPELLNKNLLNQYYSPEKLESLEARHGWVEPDLKPLD
jgi:hypothetical protein